MNPLMQKMLESGSEQHDDMLIKYLNDNELYSFKVHDVAKYRRDNDPRIVGLYMLRRDNGEMSFAQIDADLDPFNRELRLTEHD